MKTPLKVLFTILSVLYPIIVFSCLVIFHVPLRIFSLFIVFVGFLYFCIATGGNSDSFVEKVKKNSKIFISSALLLFAGIVCFITGKTIFIKLYPVFMTGIFLFTFGSTLFFPPNMCFRFACLGDKKLKNASYSKKVEEYCKKVTIIWCIFFILNGTFALITVFSNNDKLWSIYNGGIAYILMGILFAVEFLVRKVVNSKIMKSNDNHSPIPFSKFNAKSRSLDSILCYEHKWEEKKYLTWSDFLRDSAKIRSFIKFHDDCEKWILHSEDYWFFLCTFAALLQCKKQILLTANISPNFIEEIRGTSENNNIIEEIRFITDQPDQKDSDFIPEILKNAAEPTEEEKFSTPEIIADETKILMYTSGSTGHPKAVNQRMTEFEADNAFIISKWGNEFASRKLCATVSQHHIYGFLFTICLPFTLAVPFRRKRIELPDEFESLDDDSYMIIAVPAFLKRTNQAIRADSASKKLPLKNPWIFTSGGVLLPEVAKDTNEIFGFCPLEVYGSTETSGIAYRQQTVNGMEWTPFDNAKIWADEEDGCLRIISPYIKDPKGFKTGDLVDIHDDGKFILKGRADSIVKIEEKRISVTEMENRILQTGLVQDVCVVPMNDRRQYLAAALVLNREGKEKFADTEKYLINRYFHDFLMTYFENVVIPKKWRYMDSLPTDVQGKKHKLEIQALFTKEE